MKKKILIMSALLSLVLSASAEDRVTADKAEIPQGKTGIISVGLDNPDSEFTAFQFDLTLPEGLSFVLDGDGAPTYERGVRLDTSHQLQASVLKENRTIRVICFSLSNSPFAGTSGMLVGVRVKTDASIPVGTELSATLSEIEFTTRNEDKLTPSDMTVAVSVSEPMTVLDENSTELPVAEENAKVRVRRSIKADEWSTIVLPFDMTAEQVKAAFGEDVQLADFAGYETVEEGNEVTGIQVNFNAATSIKANTPCLIKVAAPISEFTVEGVDVAPEEKLVVAAVKRTSKKWSEMVGTYVADTKLGEEENEDHFLFLYGNKFWYSTGDTRMKGYRAYFDFYDVLSSVENANARVRLAINGDGTTTGVESVEFGAHKEDGSWYSLDGRRLTGKPTEKGIYIVNGKKVAID